MAGVSALQSTVANSRTALVGITTPLSDLSIPTADKGTVIAIVSARTGALTVDASAGATTSGNGSNVVWISGTTAQVNAKLATLTYASGTVGTDDLSVLLLSSNGALLPALKIAVATVPLATATPPASNLIFIDTGNLTLESRTLDGPSLALLEPAGSQSSTSCILVNSTIGAHSQLTVRNDNAGPVLPRLAIAGRVELDGTMSFAGNGTAISLAQGASFINEGSISIDAHAAQFTGKGTLVNNGRIVLTGDGTAGALPRIDTALTGSGLVSLTSGASLEIGAKVDAGETISLGAGANTLHLTQPGSFAGQIAGFSAGDRVILDGVAVTNALASRSAENDDTTVTLYNGASAVGTLRFAAPEPGTVFQLGTDGAGNATLALASVATDGAASKLDVFRFFDAAHGTQLLTQGQAERDAILGSRPDLRYEGVGLHAVDPAQPDANTTAVFRFFDKTDGTYFFTASAAERDSLVGSRPDLVLEPTSTLFEHATAQSGDAAVYRFFDNQSGAHFFTADAGERASILATRPDMTLEGIAFYAPTT